MKSGHLPEVDPGHRRDLRGQRFGYLVVEAHSHFDGERKQSYWRCLCDCGERVKVPARRLVAGKKKSCGVNGHVFRDTPTSLQSQYRSEYSSWRRMRERCTNPNHDHFKHYGGRGIEIYPEWNGFAVFLRDMGPKPSPELSIERENNDLGYGPMNCVWATRAQQDRNKRNTVYVEYEGRRLLLMDLCAELGLSRSVIYGRLKNGWDIDRALTTPVKKSAKPIASVSE